MKSNVRSFTRTPKSPFTAAPKGKRNVILVVDAKSKVYRDISRAIGHKVTVHHASCEEGAWEHVTRLRDFTAIVFCACSAKETSMALTLMACMRAQYVPKSAFMAACTPAEREELRLSGCAAVFHVNEIVDRLRERFCLEELKAAN